MDTPAMTNLEAVRDAVTNLIGGAWPDQDEEVADFTGLIRAEEVRLGEFRRLLLSETSAIEGKAYKVEESRKATRTFNTARVLSDFMDHDGTDMLTVIFDLMRSGALKLSWGWQKLEREFHKRDVTMVKAQHEIDPQAVGLDDPHVGEVWETTTRVVAK